MWWKDARLAYNGTADGGCVDKISLSQAEMAQVWKPSFYWEGAKSITMPDEDRGTGQLFEFYPDGSVWWSRQASFKLVGGSVFKPGAAETATNPRARSAKLRAAIRTDAAPWEDAA